MSRQKVALSPSGFRANHLEGFTDLALSRSRGYEHAIQ